MDKVVIIGKGLGWDKAPRDGETWGVNDVILKRPLKMSWQMHNKEHIAKYNQALSDACESTSVPIMTLENYPLETIVKHFNTDYFVNSIAYMIAYALWDGATRIDLYGVHMSNVTEYDRQKPCVEFWIGVAIGLGVAVNIHGPHFLLKCPRGKMYGYDKKQNEKLRRRNG